jgi:hypothetical protein
MVPELRLKSRQQYLKHREEQVIDLYKMNLKDEERVFDEAHLSQQEKRILELKKQLLALAEKRKNTHADQHENYQMPG